MSTTPVLRPGVSLRRGPDRHQTRIAWLHGRHSFDTGVDPFGADTHHGVLVVSNYDTIAPGSGFETHPHRNMEITGPGRDPDPQPVRRPPRRAA
jgi:quercetin 2,3-dioxygenase